ncbi:MAG: tetratricopeptide repeat protein [Muribaculaceae bacterium]|nr:tetratricopeptide repeat protein [Muribaculaceae bacterium]
MTTSLKLLISVIATAAAFLSLASCSGDNEPAQQDPSTKAERNFIRNGNKLFEEKNYAEAEVEFNKALQANPSSAVAAYNLALTLAMQAEPNDSTGIIQHADSLFNFAASITKDKQLKAMAHYNMGNLAYNSNQFDKAINDYKNALRAMPSDDDARYNLRMAQLKLQEQQQNQQNQNQDQNQDQNQNKNQNQDKNKDQNKDQNQQNQDQNKDKNQNQQDQQNQQNQNQNQNQQQQNQDQQQQQQQQAKAGQMDERSMQQVLKAMENKEKETQQKLYQMGERQREYERRNTQNKW